MGLFLLRFWPVLIPVIVYMLWFYCVGKKTTINGQPVVRFRDGPWYWALLASILIGIGCLILLGVSLPQKKGLYVPPHVKNGKLVPAEVSDNP